MLVDYLPIVAAAITAYAVGALWHSPIGFGKYWMKLMGFNHESMHSMPLTPAQAMSIGFLVTLLVAYVFDFFITMTYAFTLSASLELGFWLWLGFLAPTLANGWLWEGKSLKLFAFNAVYALINIEVMALVFGLWQ